MILAGITLTKTLIGTLIVTLAVLILVIAYRKLLRYLGKGAPVKENYAVLFGLEQPQVTGEVEFYFTLEQPRAIVFCILDSAMNEMKVVADQDFTSGGHILRFDTRTLENGVYFYCLRSDNQKTMKRMVVQHDNMAG